MSTGIEDMYHRWYETEKAAHEKTRDAYFKTLRRPPGWFAAAVDLGAFVYGVLVGMSYQQRRSDDGAVPQVCREALAVAPEARWRLTSSQTIMTMLTQRNGT